MTDPACNRDLVLAEASYMFNIMNIISINKSKYTIEAPIKDLDHWGCFTKVNLAGSGT